MNVRIRTIAEMVQKGVICADIGTDHAFLPILLIRNGICEKVYACDVAEGPLKAAQQNIGREGMSKQIITILSDGFRNVPDDADCAVIAGMGYHTAVHILEDAKPRLSSMKQIIVEVNRDVRGMRQWISGCGYTIRDERLIRDRGFVYTAISFDTEAHAPYSDEQILAGPVLMERSDEEFRNYVNQKAEDLRRIIDGYPLKPDQRAVKEEELNLWQNIKKTWSSD